MGRKVTFILAVALLVLFIGAAASCPGRDKHADSLKESVRMDNASGGGGVSARTEALCSVIDEALFTESYILFNVGEINLEHKTYAVTLGVFGHVYVLTHVLFE